MDYRAAVFHSKGNIKIENKELRQPGPREVLIRILACGECRYCRIGKANLCTILTAIGVNFEGGLIDHRGFPVVRDPRGHQDLQ